jgi:hypothetical protein
MLEEVIVHSEYHGSPYLFAFLLVEVPPSISWGSEVALLSLLMTPV